MPLRHLAKAFHWNINIEILKDLQQVLAFVLISVVTEKRLIGGVIVSPPYFLLVLVWQRQTGRLTLSLSPSTDSRDGNGSVRIWQKDVLIRTLALLWRGCSLFQCFQYYSLWICGTLDWSFWSIWLWVLLFLDRNNSASTKNVLQCCVSTHCMHTGWCGRNIEVCGCALSFVIYEGNFFER